MTLTFEIESLADLVHCPDIFEIVQNQGIAAIIANNRKGGHESATTIEFISYLTQEELSYFESKENYSKNKSKALAVIEKWAKKVIECSYWFYDRESFPGLSDNAFLALKEREIINTEKSQIERLLDI
jgi:hypothetical protein